MDGILNLIVLALAGMVAFLTFRLSKLNKDKQSTYTTEVVNSIEQLRSIGELSVFQVYSKEIVTKTDHALGGFGKDYLSWLISEKKLSMIFEFEINFIYDLRSPRLDISEQKEGEYTVLMPPCKYKFSIVDMKFYDEKNGKFMPLLLPDLINGILGSSFGEDEKNAVIAEARAEVERLSLRLINQLQGKIHKSAKDTLEAIAKSFGAKSVKFEFSDTNESAMAQLGKAQSVA